MMLRYAQIQSNRANRLGDHALAPLAMPGTGCAPGERDTAISAQVQKAAAANRVATGQLTPPGFICMRNESRNPFRSREGLRPWIRWDYVERT